MLWRFPRFQPLVRRLQVRRQWLTKEEFMIKHFDLKEVAVGHTNGKTKLKKQEEYVQYTIKLEDPLILMFTSSFCNSSLFYSTEVNFEIFRGFLVHQIEFLDI